VALKGFKGQVVNTLKREIGGKKKERKRKACNKTPQCYRSMEAEKEGYE
jgi:hypothetical protein